MSSSIFSYVPKISTDDNSYQSLQDRSVLDLTVFFFVPLLHWIITLPFWGQSFRQASFLEHQMLMSHGLNSTHRRASSLAVVLLHYVTSVHVVIPTYSLIEHNSVYDYILELTNTIVHIRTCTLWSRVHSYVEITVVPCRTAKSYLNTASFST